MWLHIVVTNYVVIYIFAFTTKLVQADSEASKMSVYKRWGFAGWSMERKNFYLTGKHKEQKLLPDVSYN